MSFFQIFLLALALAMDALALAVCLGLSLKEEAKKKAPIIGLYFGFFQALMPLIGFYITSIFAGDIAAYSSWIAFIILSFLGLKMILESMEKEEDVLKESGFSTKRMILLSVATSIDALAIGVTLALSDVKIIPAVITIGIVTFILSAVGARFGSIFGKKFDRRAEFFGGIVLVLIGLKILLEYLDIIKL